jgi:hypothetical protein
MTYRFHDTIHVEKRSLERGFTVAQVLETVTHPSRILKVPPRRGNHGGLIWLFFRAYGSTVLVVVAEIKKNECWLITGFWQ